MTFPTGNAKIFIDDETVTKFFNTRQYQDPFYRVTYDYNPLLDLQGIPSVPKLYEYKRNVFVIMERCGGTLWSNLSAEEEQTVKEWLLLALHEHYCACIYQGWVPQDVQKEHVFLNLEKHTIKIIDYGRYLSSIDPNYKMMDYSLEEWLEFSKNKIRHFFE
ncbi:protein kinase family protein [Massilibacterium senegalense]|uniref:hypothetical protein n=1 Tax=Massilibacterium senegalense TaxID=1632858 RepID=UPI000781F618|nr:hypothetical protein [Massilibacterium senegalense]